MSPASAALPPLHDTLFLEKNRMDCTGGKTGGQSDNVNFLTGEEAV